MKAAAMAPNELATPIMSILRFKANPAGTAIHNSSMPNKKTPNTDIKYSIGLIIWPPKFVFKLNQLNQSQQILIL
jgi:hypothetical protein